MATLTGKIADVTSKPPENISSITVKAPSVRIGGGTNVIVSSPATVDFNHTTGDITISGLTGGLSWLYIEGEGWADSIPLAVAEGMITLVEAIANAAGAPGMADYIALLANLEIAVGDVAQDAVDAAAGSILSSVEKIGQDVAALETPRILGSSEDLDTIFGFDYGRAMSASITSNPDLHYPPGAIHGYLRSVAINDNYTAHTWVDTWAGFVAIRIHYSGTWRDWMVLPGHQEIAGIKADIERLQSQLGSPGSVTVDSGTSVTYGDFAPQPITSLGNATYWHAPAGTTYFPEGYKGEGLVGRFAQATGYSEMTITKYGGHTRVSCINPSTNRHVTYTIEGGDSTTASSRDDFHIVREIYTGAATSGTPSMDTMIKRRSNLEFAFQMTVGGVTEFAPYHGTVNTYYLDSPTMINLATGASIDFKNMPASTVLTGVGGIQLTQQVRIEHSTQPGETIATARSVTTITPDGLLQSETVLTAVKDFEIALNYLPMTPIELEASTGFTTGRGENIQLDPSIPPSTYYTELNEGKDFTTGVFTGTGTFAAFAMLNPGATWAENIPSMGSAKPLRIETRQSSGQRKLYASPFEPGSNIRAGSTWRMAGQWRYGEADSPTQYI